MVTSRSGLMALLSVLLLSTSCADSDGSVDGEGQVSDDAVCTEDRAGGSATVATYLEPQGLDPVGLPGNAVTGGAELMALYDNLVSYDPETGKYEPRVAESVEPNDDFTVWTVKLREGITFGNGDPLTAQDVSISIDRHRSPDNFQVSSGEVKPIQEIEVVDDATLTFTLNEPYPTFPHVLATDAGMITNPRIVDERGSEGFATNPAGGGVGPYEFERYAPGEEVVLKAKDDYWGGPVCIDELRFIRIAGADATMDALEQGEVDVAFLREPQATDRARNGGFGELSTLINQGEAVIMNGAQSPTSDPLIRRAVAAAIDPEALNQRVFDGTAKATSALVAEGTVGLEPTDGPTYDPEEAKRLVAEAKQNGWDGSIQLLADNAPIRVEESIAIAAMLEAVGFDVDLSNTSPLPDISSKVVVERDYELALWGPQFYAEGTWATMNRVLGSASDSYYGYSDPAIDPMLAELRLATNDQERSAALNKIQDLLIENPFSANFVAIEETWAFASRMHGLNLDRGSVVRFEQAFVTD